MKKKTLLIPIMMMFLLVGCKSSGGSKTSKTSTSSGQESKQDVPSYEDLPEYESYDPETGPIAPNHLSGMTIDPNKELYARVGDAFTVSTTISTALDDDDEHKEKKVEFSVDKPNLLKATAIENPKYHSWRADLKCLASGDATLTAKSYEGRYVRQLVVHILPNSGKYDFFESAIDTDTAKEKFGYVSTSFREKGLKDGVSQLGHQNWKWHREKPGAMSTASGAIRFGTEKDNEGAMTFSTRFAKPVKKITLGISSARDDAQENLYIFGASKLTATMGETPLSRVVNGKTYAGGEECYTLKGTDDNTVSPHTILCNDLSGEFTFNLTESAGYIRLKYILVEYSDYTPSGTLTEANYSFDDAAFTDLLTTNFTKKTVSDLNGEVNIVLTKVKTGSESSSNHPVIDRSSYVTITPKNVNKSIVSVEFVTSNYIVDGEPIENIVDVEESYTASKVMQNYGRERDETIVLSRLSYGCNVVQFKNVSAGEGILLGIVSIKVTLTDAVNDAVVDKIELVGTPDKMDYSGGDSFDPSPASVNVSFNDEKFMLIQINDLMTWPELTEGDTSTTGTSVFGDLIVEGITTSEYVGKTWVKAESGGAGHYLVVTQTNKMLFDASSSKAEMQSGSSNRDISEYFDGDEIHGDYKLDHSFISVINASTSGEYKVNDATDSYGFSGISDTTAKLSFATGGGKGRNHKFEIVDGELQLYFVSKEVRYTFCLAKSPKTDDDSIFFSFVDFTSDKSRIVERVFFYQVK